MARYVASVATPLWPDAAFAEMADVTRFPEWDPGTKRAVRVAGDGASVGTVYELTVEAGTTSVMRYEVKEWEPPRRLLMIARTAVLTSVDEIRVQPTASGSVVTYDATLTLRGPLRLFDPFLGLLLKRIGDRAAVGLRRFLSGTAVS